MPKAKTITAVDSVPAAKSVVKGSTLAGLRELTSSESKVMTEWTLQEWLTQCWDVRQRPDAPGKLDRKVVRQQNVEIMRKGVKIIGERWLLIGTSNRMRDGKNIVYSVLFSSRVVDDMDYQSVLEDMNNAIIVRTKVENPGTDGLPFMDRITFRSENGGGDYFE